MDNDQILIFGCSTSFGNPSGHSIAAVSFFLSFWFVIFQCEEMKNKTSLKSYSLGFIILLIIAIIFSRIVVGAHSFNQILYGGLIGFAIFLLFFYVLQPELNKPDGLLWVISLPVSYFAIANFLIFIVCLILYYLIKVDVLQIWKDNIAKKCPDNVENELYSTPGMLAISFCLSYIGVILGLKMEYSKILESKKQTFTLFNFEKNVTNPKQFTLLSAIHITDDSQWNHTGFTKSIIRLVVFYGMSIIIYIPTSLIGNDSNMYVVMIFKMFLPATIWFFCLFFLFKVIFLKLNLLNPSSLPMESQSRINLANLINKV